MARYRSRRTPEDSSRVPCSCASLQCAGRRSVRRVERRSSDERMPDECKGFPGLFRPNGVSPIRVSAWTGLLVFPASDRRPSVVLFLPRTCRPVECRKGTPVLDNLAMRNTDSVNALENHALPGGRNAPKRSSRRFSARTDHCCDGLVHSCSWLPRCPPSLMGPSVDAFFRFVVRACWSSVIRPGALAPLAWRE